MLLGLARGIGGRDLRLLAPGIVALGVLLSMTGIVQKALWSGKVYGFWEPVNKGDVAFGPLINRNHFAGWVLMALPLVMGFALTLTLSRSGISCSLLAMVLSAVHALRRQQSTAKGRLLGTYLALVLVGLFAREVRRRFREAHDDRTGYWLRLGAVTGIVAIAFQERVEFSLQMPGNAALFTVLCAIAVRKASVKGPRLARGAP